MVSITTLVREEIDYTHYFDGTPRSLEYSFQFDNLILRHSILKAVGCATLYDTIERDFQITHRT